jgi:hypothetical protein
MIEHILYSSIDLVIRDMAALLPEAHITQKSL